MYNCLFDAIYFEVKMRGLYFIFGFFLILNFSFIFCAEKEKETATIIEEPLHKEEGSLKIELSKEQERILKAVKTTLAIEGIIFEEEPVFLTEEETDEGEILYESKDVQSGKKILVLDPDPCKEVKPYSVIFVEPYKKEHLGSRRCENGKEYDHYRVTKQKGTFAWE